MKGFFSQLDMVCWSKEQISIIVQMFFFGIALTLLYLPLPDKYGRKLALLFLSPALALSFSMALYGQNSWVKAIGYLINGAASGRYSVCLSMCIESSESKYGALASTIIFAIDVSSFFLTCVFLRFVSSDAF